MEYILLIYYFDFNVGCREAPKSDAILNIKIYHTPGGTRVVLENL